VVLPWCKTRHTIAHTHRAYVCVCVCVCVCVSASVCLSVIQAWKFNSHPSNQAFKRTHKYCCVRNLCNRLCYLTQNYKHMLCESTTHNIYSQRAIDSDIFLLEKRGGVDAKLLTSLTLSHFCPLFIP
jgi:hypothetical protein